MIDRIQPNRLTTKRKLIDEQRPSKGPEKRVRRMKLVSLNWFETASWSPRRSSLSSDLLYYQPSLMQELIASCLRKEAPGTKGTACWWRTVTLILYLIDSQVKGNTSHRLTNRSSSIIRLAREHTKFGHYSTVVYIFKFLSNVYMTSSNECWTVLHELWSMSFSSAN